MDANGKMLLDIALGAIVGALNGAADVAGS